MGAANMYHNADFAVTLSRAVACNMVALVEYDNFVTRLGQLPFNNSARKSRPTKQYALRPLKLLIQASVT